MTRTAAPIEDHRFPCPTCGSDLRYLPGSDLLHCDHCGNEEPIRDPGPWTGAIVELDFEAALKHALPAQEIAEIRSVTCQSCGATVEYDESLHARECPFCATPFVTGTGTHRMIKPKGTRRPPGHV